jgi:hypothetical protein
MRCVVHHSKLDCSTSALKLEQVNTPNPNT